MVASISPDPVIPLRRGRGGVGADDGRALADDGGFDGVPVRSIGGVVMLSSLLQAPNAAIPMLVTLVGIVTHVSS